MSIKTALAALATIALLASGTLAAAGSAQATPAKAPDPGYIVSAYNTDGGAVRWWPCKPLPWRVNLNGMPRSEIRLIKAAFTQAAKATGRDFTFAGQTSILPRRNIMKPDAGIGMLLTFAAPGKGPKQSPLVKGYIENIGTQSDTYAPGMTQYLRASAQINLDYAKHSDKDIRTIYYLRAIGAMLGLGYTDGKNIMNDHWYGATHYTADDLAGLAKVGRQNGDCATTPTEEPAAAAPARVGPPAAMTSVTAVGTVEAGVKVTYAWPADAQPSDRAAVGIAGVEIVYFYYPTTTFTFSPGTFGMGEHPLVHGAVYIVTVTPSSTDHVDGPTTSVTVTIP